MRTLAEVSPAKPNPGGIEQWELLSTAGCRGFSKSQMSGVVPKAQLPGSGGRWVSLDSSCVPTRARSPKTRRGSIRPHASAARIALLFRNPSPVLSRVSAKQQLFNWSSAQALQSIIFAAPFLWETRTRQEERTFRDERLLQAVGCGSAPSTAVGAAWGWGIYHLRKGGDNPPALHYTCAMPRIRSLGSEMFCLASSHSPSLPLLLLLRIRDEKRPCACGRRGCGLSAKLA